jgi:hypothetical protein
VAEADDVVLQFLGVSGDGHVFSCSCWVMGSSCNSVVT